MDGDIDAEARLHRIHEGLPERRADVDRAEQGLAIHIPSCALRCSSARFAGARLAVARAARQPRAMPAARRSSPWELNTVDDVGKTVWFQIPIPSEILPTFEQGMKYMMATKKFLFYIRNSIFL